VAIAVAWPRVRTANLLNDHYDAQYTNLFEESARLAVARFHELPLWNPYYCGGIYGLATPSARFVSPTFILTLLFGTLRANVLIVMGLSVLGMEGMFRYARSRGGSSLTAMTAAPAFALSGLFSNAGSFDWINFYSFQMVPWALLGVRRLLLGERRGLVLAALSFAAMLGFGGTYSAPLTAIAAAVEVVATLAGRARSPGKVARGLLLASLVLPLAAAVGMVRIWPVAEMLAASPRYIGGVAGETPVHLWTDLTGAWWNGFHRNDFAVGLPILVLLFLGVCRKKAIPLTAAAVTWIWLAMGYKVTPSLFAALRHIPPYTMLRAPERFLLFFALVAVALVALGVRKLEAIGRGRPGWLALATVVQVLLIGNTVALAMNDWSASTGRKMVPPPATMARDFRQARGNRWLAAYYPFQSRGTLSCFDDYDIPMSPALRGDLAHEEYLEDTAAGTVTRTSWSPNQIRVHVELVKPARVYFNTNWHPGWRSDAGQVVEDNGLLTVDLPAGTHDVTLRFHPRSALGGLATTALGLVVAGFFWVDGRRRPVFTSTSDGLRTAALCLVPFTATILVVALIHEPRRPPPLLVTPAGEPLVTNALPDGAKTDAVRWEHGITLEGHTAKVEPSPDGRTVVIDLELDFRLDEALPPGLGVLVHFEPPGDRVAIDHVLLSGAIPFEDAPTHATIRDVLDPMTLPRGKDPWKCKVYIGVWWALRDATRLKVLSARPGTVQSSRALIESFEIP